MKKTKRLWIMVGIVALILICGLLFYFGGRWLETRNYTETRGTLSETEETETRKVNGVTYRRRKNLKTILVMGIDRDSDVESDSPFEGGQADFQRLVVIDSDEQTVRQLKIDRDTMTEVTILGYFGSPIGTKEMQISLAHGFGDGKEQSCEYAQEAVEGLLNGESIDFYIAMNLDGISELNDLAGGVTVTLEDDFSMRDPAMTKGTTLTLHGKQAEYYVRSRMDIGVGTNEARMARQETYLNQLFSQLEEKNRQDKQFAATMYDSLTPYLVSDMAKGRLINEVWAARDYTVETALELTGKHQVAEDGFMEFYADEKSIEQAILNLFWEPVK